MTRWLPAIAGLSVGLAVLGIAVTGAVGGDDPREPVILRTPIFSPYCNLEPEKPCPPGPELLSDEGNDTSQPPIPEFVPPINGHVIPLPEGVTVGTVMRDPGGLSYIYHRGKSHLQFQPNGWLLAYEVAPEDAKDFEPVIDALFVAADPIALKGETIRLPRGVTYERPIFAHAPDGYIGLPEEAPNLHLIRRGESLISFDTAGTIIAQRIHPEDADDFGPIIRALDN